MDKIHHIPNVCIEKYHKSKDYSFRISGMRSIFAAKKNVNDTVKKRTATIMRAAPSAFPALCLTGRRGDAVPRPAIHR